MERREPDKTEPAKLIVLLSFVRSEDGDLVPYGEAQEMRDEQSAKRLASQLAPHRAGVVAWTRTADLVNGEFGEPVVIARHGDVPEME